MDWINHGLAAILTTQWAVPTIVGLMLAGFAAIVAVNGRRYHSGMKRALESRLRALQPIELASSTAEAQIAFRDRFDEIDAAMRADDGAREMVHAWFEYRETFFDEDRGILKTTERPDGYFLHLGDHTRVLAWWANIFVALGLTATFLGIIAALTVTTDGLHRAGTDAAGMSGALTDLLHLTAAKFWTSIGGVGVSIALRIVDRTWHSYTAKRLSRITYAIEKGTLYVPAQRLAADQLRELEQQTVALRAFSTQLAVSIGDALDRNLQPVVTGLGTLQTSIGEQLRPLEAIRTTMDEFKTGSFDQIGKELGAAISQGAGTEMTALARQLEAMTTGIQGVNDRLEGASGQASEQIATAAREFSSASEAMTRAFATLNGRLETMAGQMATETEAAQERGARRVAEDHARYQEMADDQRAAIRGVTDELGRASAASTEVMIRAVRDAVGGAMTESGSAIRGALEGFAEATAGIRSAFDQMRGQVAELGTALSASAGDAATRNADVLARAAAALDAATTRTSEGLGAALDSAISRSAEESGRAISAAFAAFGDRFKAASEGLVDTLRTTAGRMEALVGAIERSTGAAGDHAGKLADAGREAQGVAAMLGRAASDVSTAAAPIRDATNAIRDSVGQSREVLRRAGEEGTRNAEALQATARTLEQASASAKRAWDGYHDRFEGVDESLGGVLDKIQAASAQHANNLNEHVGRIDNALGQAVNTLSQALDPLSELANELSDVLQTLRSR